MIFNKTKAEREKQAATAPRVGSASIVSRDEWVGIAAANQKRREIEGSTFNPFVRPAGVLCSRSRPSDEIQNMGGRKKRADASSGMYIRALLGLGQRDARAPVCWHFRR